MLGFFSSKYILRYLSIKIQKTFAIQQPADKYAFIYFQGKSKINQIISKQILLILRQNLFSGIHGIWLNAMGSECVCMGNHTVIPV